ncbi:MAG: acetyl-CoA carboxylase biotin carboxylase subunit [bacterium]
MFKKILIANRGEVALRVIRAAKEFGLATVAVYSQADAESLHVRFADEAICIGPPKATSSYLSMSQIIAAAEVTGAEAIHPGSGFLAENPTFAEICEEHHFRFIGPAPEAIRTMGDKAEARKIAVSAGVPIIPGCENPISSEKEALEIAEKVGYPVLLKAVAGGGGKGMRVVEEDRQMRESLAMAQAEAQAAFANPQLYLERYIAKPRHIEVQILADSLGNMVHLGERECSIQFRHQKLLEETPSPIVDPKLRKELGEAALRLAKVVNYSNAGTVEFILDKEGKFYFIEMNTRIQVEHPITEVTTNIDLIKEQIRLSAGENLGYTQKDIKFSGHAIECRINAADPKKNLAPSPGKITDLHLPAGPGVRIDSHIYSGYSIPLEYDSLLAKLIVCGKDRTEAIARMSRALNECVIEGIATTVPLHLQIMEDKDFREGVFDTHFLERYV